MIPLVRQPDIGRCDDCGTDEGRRRKTLRTVTVGGKPERVEVYLCPECFGRHLAAGAGR